MNTDLLIVLGLLVAAIAMFVADKPRMDVVALIMIVALPATGIISMNEALAGFADANVVLIAALFVIGEALCVPASRAALATGCTRAPAAAKRSCSCC
jgi:di/tricarboxylate transporter